GATNLASRWINPNDGLELRV
nr:hypothetical protein [Tanacetum cinerariifolium]